MVTFHLICNREFPAGLFAPGGTLAGKVRLVRPGGAWPLKAVVAGHDIGSDTGGFLPELARNALVLPFLAILHRA